MLEWPFDLTVYAGLVGLFLGHAWLATDRDLPRIKSLYFGLGLLAIWLRLEAPIDTLADYYRDSASVLKRVLWAGAAPPLLLLGLNGDMAGVLVRVPGVRAITEPIPAQVISAAVMIGWHIPPFYDATLYSVPLHV